MSAPNLVPPGTTGGGAPVGGSGTPGTLAKFATASSVGDSAVLQAAGAIATVTLTNGGAAYTNGTYGQRALTGGAGTAATADFIVAGGIVTFCLLRAPGVGYLAGDVLSCATIGPGAGLVVTVATVVPAVSTVANVTANRLGAGNLPDGPNWACHVNGMQAITGQAYTGYKISATQTIVAYLAQYITANYIHSTSAGFNALGTAYYLEVDASLQTTTNVFARNIQCVTPYVSASAVGTGVFIYGIFASAYRQAPGDISTNAANQIAAVVAAAGVLAGTGASTTALVIDFRATMFNSSATHTIGEYAFFRGDAPGNSGFPAGAIITNFYGLRLQAMGSAGALGTITNRYPIAQEDTLGTNFFRAKTAFGPAVGTAPGDALASVEITTNGTTNGNLRLNTANAVLDVSAASTNGVRFNNPGTPGITSVTLANYQEGTFTVTDGSGAGLVITQNMAARYTRIGKNVTVICDITYPATANTDPAQVLLPIPVGASTYGGGAIVYSSTAARFGLVYDTVCLLYVYGAPAQSTNASLSGQSVIITMTYVLA